MSERARKVRYELTYNPIREYFDEIQNGKVVSLKVYKVYKELVRIMDDPNSEWEYSAKKANHALEFVENYCRHSKGRYGGKRFRLELWQKALIAATFGIVHKITGLRKYRQVMLVVGRKNGKSTLSAAIGLYLQIADGELGAEIYACATKKDQAKIIWLEAKKMVKKSPTLLRRIKPKVAELEADYNDSYFRPLGSARRTECAWRTPGRDSRMEDQRAVRCHRRRNLRKRTTADIHNNDRRNGTGIHLRHSVR